MRLGQLADFLERESPLLGPADEGDAFQIFEFVAPVTGGRSLRRIQQMHTLIVSNGLYADTGPPCQFTDAHETLRAHDLAQTPRLALTIVGSPDARPVASASRARQNQRHREKQSKRQIGRAPADQRAQRRRNKWCQPLQDQEWHSRKEQAEPARIVAAPQDDHY